MDSPEGRILCARLGDVLCAGAVARTLPLQFRSTCVTLEIGSRLPVALRRNWSASSSPLDLANKSTKAQARFAGASGG
jgi:hypothetical protein